VLVSNISRTISVVNLFLDLRLPNSGAIPVVQLEAWNKYIPYHWLLLSYLTERHPARMICRTCQVEHGRDATSTLSAHLSHPGDGALVPETGIIACTTLTRQLGAFLGNVAV
jgi:hypothetical protein